MNVRIHQGLICIFAAAIVGAAGCASGDTGKPKPTTQKPAPRKPGPGKARPGKARPAGTTAECFGPSMLATAAREQLVGQVCGAGGRRPIAASRGRRGGVCASAYQVRSDAQIAGLLSAWNDAVIRDSTTAEREAVDPGVRDLAHLLLASHTRARDEQGAVFGRISIRPEETAGSRALGGSSGAVCGGPKEQGSAQATSFDRAYVARQVEAAHRSLQLVDALVPQARSADLRCSLEASRAVTEAQLDEACWVWASINGKVGTARSAEEAAEPTDTDELTDLDELTDTGELTDAGEAEASTEPDASDAP